MEATYFTSTLKLLGGFRCFLTVNTLFHNIFKCLVCLFDPQRQRLYDDKLHVAAWYSPFNVTIGTPSVTGSNYKCRESCDIIQYLFSWPMSGPRARKIGPRERQGIYANQCGNHFRSSTFHWNSRTGRSLSLIYRWFVNQDLYNLPGRYPALPIFLNNTGGTYTIHIRPILASERCHVFRHLLVVPMNSKAAETWATPSCFQ